MTVEPMRCDSCREPIEAAFYVVDGRDWCARCEQRVTPSRMPVWRARLGGLAAGLAAAIAASAAVGLLPMATPVHLTNGWALPIGLLIGGAVRLGRWNGAAPGLPLSAAVLTYLVVTFCHTYGIANIGGDASRDVSMTDFFLRLVVEPDLSALVLMPVLPILFGLMTVVGGLSLGVGLYAAFAVARGVPVAVDGPFEVTPGAPRPAHEV